MSDFFVHPNAICESGHVGKGTRVWAFAHVLPGARIGADCNICDGVFIENDVVIGDRVTVKCGVQLWDGLRVESDVFIGPNATFTNDQFPRSKVRPTKFATTLVRQGASIGANATILPGLEIGSGAMVGAGAVVTRSVPPFAIAVGNPAAIVGYVGSDEQQNAGATASAQRIPESSKEVSVRGVQLQEMPLVHDMRGDLSVGEFGRSIPFEPRRYFLVFDVPTREIRGEHAHKTCHQFLVCVKGTCSIVVDDGTRRQELLLDRPNIGVLISAGVWATQYKYSPDAVLLVFASEYYDAADYIRSYGEFRRWLAATAPGAA